MKCNQWIYLLMISLMTVACTDEVEDEKDKDEENVIGFNGDTYQLNGMLEDWGLWDATGLQEETHLFFNFVLCNGEFYWVGDGEEGREDGYFETTMVEGIYIDFPLFSPGTQHFQSGMFKYVNELNVGPEIGDFPTQQEDLLDEAFFHHMTITHGDYWGSDVEEWVVTGGQVEVTHHGGFGFTLDFDVQVQLEGAYHQLDPETEQNVKFSYATDEITYQNLTGAKPWD